LTSCVGCGLLGVDVPPLEDLLNLCYRPEASVGIAYFYNHFLSKWNCCRCPAYINYSILSFNTRHTFIVCL